MKWVNLKANYSAFAQTSYNSNDQMVFAFGHAGFPGGTNYDRAKATQVVMRGTSSP